MSEFCSEVAALHWEGWEFELLHIDKIVYLICTTLENNLVINVHFSN